MKIILEGEEAELYLLSRRIGELKSFVKELEEMHDGLRRCNRFELTDLCNKIGDLLDTVKTNEVLVKLARQ